MLYPNDKKDKTRKTPRFPISSWNVFQRVIDDEDRTNNPVESWHSQFKMGLKKKLTLAKLIFLLILEQGKVKKNIAQLDSGLVIKKKKKLFKKMKKLNILY